MCLALEHNTMTRVGALTAWTQTAQSGVSFGLCISHVYYTTSSASGQDEPNLAL